MHSNDGVRVPLTAVIVISAVTIKTVSIVLGSAVSRCRVVSISVIVGDVAVSRIIAVLRRRAVSPRPSLYSHQSKQRSNNINTITSGRLPKPLGSFV